MVRTGATFADAAAEYLRYIEQDRGRKPSTLRGYRSTIDLPRSADDSEVRQGSRSAHGARRGRCSRAAREA
jgi:hypothetical protein